MLQDDPQDQMLRYMLAMEQDKAGEHQDSLALFDRLRAEQHVPSYFMSAQQMVRLGDLDQAKAVLRDGIEEARRQQNDHAAGEMSEFLRSLSRINGAFVSRVSLASFVSFASFVVGLPPAFLSFLTGKIEKSRTIRSTPDVGVVDT